MKNNTVYLTDIKEAIEKIEKYTFNVDFEHFKDDDMQQDAVIRQFMVIGEATNRRTSIIRVCREKNSTFPFGDITGSV